MRERAGDRHALLLAARQLARELVLVRHQAHAVEHLEAAGLGLVGRAAQHLDLRDREVLGHRQVREQLEVLEHHADLGAQLRQVGLGVVQRDAVDGDLALLEGFERVHGLDERGLARARGTADHDHVALGDADRAVVEHLHGAVPLGDVLDFDHFFGHFFLSGSVLCQRMMAIFLCRRFTRYDSA
jgi:hypothetical protein